MKTYGVERGGQSPRWKFNAAARSAKRVTGAVILAAGLALTGAEANKPAGPYWAQFRGPNGTGLAAEGKYPVHFGPETNVRWKTEVPGGVSSPCIWGDRIFLTSFEKTKRTLETICLDRGTGKVVWRQPAPAEKIENVHQVSSAANGTPAADGERVYVYFASYGLLCYDIAGQLLWKKPFPLVASRFGSGASPIVVEGKVILIHDEASGLPGVGPGASGGKSDNFLLAVNGRDGETLWQTPRAPSYTKYSTPAHWRGAGGDLILVTGAAKLAAYDLKTGKEVWWLNDIPPQLLGIPMVTKDRVFFAGTGMFGEPENFVQMPAFEELAKKSGVAPDGLVPLASIPKDLLIVDRRASGGAGNSPLVQFIAGADRNGDKSVSKEEWEEFKRGFTGYVSSAKPAVGCIRLGGSGDISKSHVAWTETRGVPEVPSLLHVDERLYGVRNGGIVHCRNAGDGREIYSERLDAPGGYYASPVAGDGKIYFASDRGMLTVLATGEKFSVLARNDLKERVIATPALVGGVMYVRTDTRLYAFEER
jgi:outer membrane protein assembly factor BamB